MKTIIAVILTVTISLIGFSTVYAGMKAGLWEISSKMEMPGMPMEMPAVTFRQCIEDQDNVPHDAKQNPDCKVMNTKVDGNTVIWDMQCSGRGGNTKGTGKIVYSGDTFQGTSRVVSEGMEMTQTMSGRRIGNCK